MLTAPVTLWLGYEFTFWAMSHQLAIACFDVWKGSEYWCCEDKIAVSTKFQQTVYTYRPTCPSACSVAEQISRGAAAMYQYWSKYNTINAFIIQIFFNVKRFWIIHFLGSINCRVRESPSLIFHPLQPKIVQVWAEQKRFWWCDS